MKQSSIDAIERGVLTFVLKAAKGERISKTAAREFAVEGDYISVGGAYFGDLRHSYVRPNGRKLLAEIIKVSTDAILR